MKAPSRPLAALGALLLLLAQGVLPAASGAAAMPHAPEDSGPRVPPSGWLIVDGEGTVSGVEVEVDCGEVDLGLIVRVASCTIRARMSLRTEGGLSMRPRPSGALEGRGADYLEAGGSPLLEGSRALSAGQSVEVRMERHFTVATSIELDTEPFVIRANAARHLLLGESPDIDRDDGSFRDYLVTGGQLTVEGTPSLQPRLPAHMDASANAWNGDVRAVLVDVGIDAIEEAGEVFQNGGPVLSLGARIRNLDQEPSDLLLGVGYEFVLYEHLFLRAAFETDFSSMYQSLVFEVGSPHLLYIFPSLVAGLGAVVAERPDGRVEGALRLRLAGQLPMLVAGVGIDFDYWPETGTWSGSVTARVSF